MGGEKERRKGKDEGKARRTEREEGRPGNEVCRREGGERKQREQRGGERGKIGKKREKSGIGYRRQCRLDKEWEIGYNVENFTYISRRCVTDLTFRGYICE